MKQQKFNINNLILDFIKQNPLCSSKEVHDGINGEFGYATVKRTIQRLLEDYYIEVEGKGKATKYKISKGYELIYPIDVEEYFRKEIDEREIKDQFNHSLIKHTLSDAEVFTKAELEYLSKLQDRFAQNASRLSAYEYNKELERLAIDLSWKSSQIEGNTYSLLETERLLKDKETASGKTKQEAVMLLNHKEAIDFIVSHPDYVKPLKVSKIEDIHSILVKELDIDRNIRKRRVGISGTNYKPLDNEFQIREALEQTCKLINRQQNTFSRAFLILVLISYIQAFSDGNKRTARIVSNAILISDKYCPISFRTVDSVEYKKAMLIFYEQNNLSALKRIFINQFEFAVDTYF